MEYIIPFKVFKLPVMENNMIDDISPNLMAPLLKIPSGATNQTLSNTKPGALKAV